MNLGGSPYLSRHHVFNPNKFNAAKNFKFDILPGNIENSTWKSENFSLRKYYQAQPYIFLAIFFHLKIERFSNNSLVLAPTAEYSYFDSPEKFYETLKEMFENLEDTYHVGPQFKKILKKQMFLPVCINLWKFSKARTNIEKKYENEEYTAMSVEELQNLTAYDDLNWLEIINGQLLKKSWIAKNEKVYVKKKLIKELAENLFNFDAGFVE